MLPLFWYVSICFSICYDSQFIPVNITRAFEEASFNWPDHLHSPPSPSQDSTRQTRVLYLYFLLLLSPQV